MKDFYSVHLQPADLMELENYLASALRGFLPFYSHSLYFPKPNSIPEVPSWHPRERILHLPLKHEGNFLGVFMARGVDGRTLRRLFPSLEALVSLCMDYILSVKKSRVDELTGLARMPRLLEQMQDNVDLVRSYWDSAVEADYESFLHNACMGLVVLRSPALDTLSADFGYTFAHKALHEWTKTIKEHLPAQVLAARSGENECTLLLHAATRNSCMKIIEEIMEHTDALKLLHSSSKRNINLRSIAGFALYPQDMETTGASLEMTEQAHRILQKARHAAHMAQERHRFLQKPQQNLAQNRYMSYAQVLLQGGIVSEILPFGQILINLGRYGGAQEGQHFSVLGQKNNAWHCKGEIVLMQVRDLQSVAEVLYMNDPAWSFEKGDNLKLLTGKKNIESTTGKTMADINLENNTTLPHILFLDKPLLSHGDFLHQLTQYTNNQNHFALALVRLHPQNHKDFSHKNCEMERILQLCQNIFSEEDVHINDSADIDKEKKSKTPTLVGKYGETSLIFFHPHCLSENIEDIYKKLAQQAAGKNITLATGIAAYPFLQANKGDILEYCHKALNLALLLKAPQVGTMGTLALNISADERYSRGDVFGAVEEYKMALLADDQNAMAWNSLGVCMAALSRQQEAQQYFKDALKLWKKMRLAKNTVHKNDVEAEQKTNIVNGFLNQINFSLENELAATLYNLGTVCQNLAEVRAAVKYFKECIKVNKSHYFAYIRLGQLAELDDKFNVARKYYNFAAELERNSEHTQNGQTRTKTGMAFRFLANIEIEQNNLTKARELLHETLLFNPQDALALCMLAKIYLNAGEDPTMSEMLARKSVNLRPKYAPAWNILAKSLRLLGRETEALQAEERAVAL